jgi:hypothetical protein
MNTKLCLLFSEELWFQISELIQDLIILVKNCFFIDIKGKNNIWNVFGKNLLIFFKNFSNIEFEILPKLSSIILTIGIIRFHQSFNEDKIVLIEAELFKNINIFGSNLAIILFFQELRTLYNSLFYNQFTLIPFLYKVFSKKINFFKRKKRFLLFFLKNHLLKIKFSKIEAEDTQNDAILSYHERKIYKKIFFQINTNRIKNNKVYFSRNSMHFNLFDENEIRKINTKSFSDSNTQKSDFLELEKKDWFFNFSYRNIKFKKICSTFFLNSFNNSLIQGKICSEITIFYQKKIFAFYNYSYKINLRWSQISKKMNGNKIFIEDLFQYILLDLMKKIFLNQERQIILMVRGSYTNKSFGPDLSKNFDYDIKKTLHKILALNSKNFSPSIYYAPRQKKKSNHIF